MIDSNATIFGQNCGMTVRPLARITTTENLSCRGYLSICSFLLTDWGVCQIDHEIKHRSRTSRYNMQPFYWSLDVENTLFFSFRSAIHPTTIPSLQRLHLTHFCKITLPHLSEFTPKFPIDHLADFRVVLMQYNKRDPFLQGSEIVVVSSSVKHFCSVRHKIRYSGHKSR